MVLLVYSFVEVRLMKQSEVEKSQIQQLQLISRSNFIELRSSKGADLILDNF